MIEDDPGVIRDLRPQLEKMGYEVHATLLDWKPDEWNRENQPKMVQIDGLDGLCFNLYEELKEDNPNATYVIFTGDGNLVDELKRRELPYILKTMSGYDQLLGLAKKTIEE